MTPMEMVTAMMWTPSSTTPMSGQMPTGIMSETIRINATTTLPAGLTVMVMGSVCPAMPFPIIRTSGGMPMATVLVTVLMLTTITMGLLTTTTIFRWTLQSGTTPMVTGWGTTPMTMTMVMVGRIPKMPFRWTLRSTPT